MSTNPTPAPAALPNLSTPSETGSQTRSIRPLGDQLIIKVIPQESWKGILIPDSAKGPTITGEKGSEDAVHFVQAEVIAVGPGSRSKGDPKLIPAIVSALHDAAAMIDGPGPELHADDELVDRLMGLAALASVEDRRLPLTVSPGDLILYHPAVQKFDRRVEGLGDGEYYIIGEHSVLAILEAE